MKNYILTLLALCGAAFAFAQTSTTLPAGLHFEVRNDTIFICSDDDSAMPHHAVFQQADRPNVYRRIYNDETDDLMEDHPASDIYTIWTRDHVNPYKVPVDSMQDSISISMKGFTLPHPGYVTSKFGPRRYRYHYGTDIKVQIGDSIRSCFDGQVRIVGWDPKGYGHYVVVRHDNGLETVYGHMSTPLVDENMRVFSGDVLGLGGNTGRSTGPHLHFEFRYLGTAFNSELVINYETGKLRCDTTYLITKASTFGYKKAVAPQTGATNYSGVKYYTIRKGDTLTTIARRNQTTVKALCKLNGIKENTIIREGRKLRVR
ncbi:MAG: peptidoglycan DD-metalloendopeptidase family protein [Bacteroidales bacterium]|nr:peptidoglycan DD-metalloendopeptidase family protein [Candidatus Colicola faecequi]